MEEGGEGRGERGRVAKVTKDPQVRTLVRAETEKSQATPAQKSQVTPDRSHKRPLYPCGDVMNHTTRVVRPTPPASEKEASKPASRVKR